MPERTPTNDEYAVFKAAADQAQAMNKRLKPIATKTEKTLAAGAKFPSRARN